MVPDIEGRIVEALNELRARYTYVFTTGGIGPTHDDITADAVAKAFGVTIDVDARAVYEMNKRYSRQTLTPARLRMARIPEGAELIENIVSRAPGFRIGNVYVMAGIPNIMQAMLDAAAPTLKTGRRLLSRTVPTDLPEGAVSEPLGAIAKRHKGVMIGSYPRFESNRFSTRIVVRSREEGLLAEVVAEIEAMVAGIDREAAAIRPLSEPSHGSEAKE
jgi:molybdopterin-biosynthesis enzyme MoeA-like protein